MGFRPYVANAKPISIRRTTTPIATPAMRPALLAVLLPLLPLLLPAELLLAPAPASTPLGGAVAIATMVVVEGRADGAGATGVGVGAATGALLGALVGGPVGDDAVGVAGTEPGLPCCTPALGAEPPVGGATTLCLGSGVGRGVGRLAMENKALVGCLVGKGDGTPGAVPQ